MVRELSLRPFIICSTNIPVSGAQFYELITAGLKEDNYLLSKSVVWLIDLFSHSNSEMFEFSTQSQGSD